MKKDQDYIVRLEKAIAQKYGTSAIQNPKSNWTDEKEREYLSQLRGMAKNEKHQQDQEEKVETNGYFISKKLLNKDTNRTCPVCAAYSFESSDDVYMSKFECCRKCYIQWVEDREERWATGWRPQGE
tara:strand:- start:2493 stop:2873 length:381 start_codon:yes stop_codon:yes gene_type:complete